MDMEKKIETAGSRLWRVAVAALFATALVVFWQAQHLYAAVPAAPATQDAPAHGGDDSGDIKVYALLTISPTEGMIGTWIIGGVAYTATESTQFSTEHGDFVVGGCVEVEVSASDPTVATEIGTEEMSKCTGTPGDDDGDDHGDDDHGDDQGEHHGDDDHDDDGEHHGDDDIKRFGLIEELPSGDVLTGTWMIAGITYTVTEETELENEHGDFEVDKCVKVEVDASDPTVATEIETEPAYKCSGQPDGDGAHGKLYGEVRQLPEDGLIGWWIVSGVQISVTEQTELESADAITVGVTVKVEFIVISDTLVAKEIELKFGRHDDDDDDDDKFGERHGREGQAYGIVNSRPISPEVTGLWVIASVEYSVTERTNFRHDEDPQVGDVVKVKYFVDSDGNRIAHKIHLEDGQGRLDNPNMNKLVGIVDSKPITGFVGLWLIAGAEFSATVDTRFHEEHGLLVEGAYVEVLYVIEDNVRRIVKIETHVPPGAGDDNSVGEVESVDDSAATVAAVATNAIMVDGVSYTITPATQIVDDDGEIVVGATVNVNSYATDGGENIATRVSSVTLDNMLVLPLAQR